jgi:hypothetical protein
MIITKSRLSRRTFLRGAGASLALPLLDAMVPAATALAQTPANAPTRFSALYLPNGVAMPAWTPATEGVGFTLSPTLTPLEPFRDTLIVVTNLDNAPNGVAHAPRPTGYLTGVRDGEGLEGSSRPSNVRASVSADQILASAVGGQTPLPSLEISLDPPDPSGAGCCGGACVYHATISWRNEKTPLPMEINPRAVFEQLFGDSGSTDRTARLARANRKRSVLDSLTERVAELKRELGPRDSSRVDEYLEAVRDVEKRIQQAEAPRELPRVDQPAGIPSTFIEHARLMLDLQVLAWQSDLTRISTFMFGREVSGRAYPEVGVPEAHHATSHHRYEAELVEKCARINTFHTTLLAEQLAKLRATPDGDGSLLDHMIIMYGAGMSDSHAHSGVGLPITVLGGRLNTPGNRHIVYPKGTPLANLTLTLMDKFGVPVEKLGHSSGKLSIEPVSL